MWTLYLTIAVGTLGVVLNLLLAWPQVWRAAKQGGDGVALETVLLGFLGRALWSTYAIRAHDLALLIGQAPVALGFAAIAWFVARGRRSLGTSLLLSVGVSLSLTIATVLAAIAPTVLTVIATCIAAAVNLPQMVRSIRTPGTASGVSELMYWFTAAASATWLSYGFVVSDLAISAPHFVLLPTGIATALVIHRRNTMGLLGAPSDARSPALGGGQTP